MEIEGGAGVTNRSETSRSSTSERVRSMQRRFEEDVDDVDNIDEEDANEARGDGTGASSGPEAASGGEIGRREDRMSLLMQRFRENMNKIAHEETESGVTKGKRRWGALRQSIAITKKQPQGAAAKEAPKTAEENLEALRKEDVDLMEFWDEKTIPPPPTLEDRTDEKVGYQPGPLAKTNEYLSQFEEVANSQGVEITRVPESVVEAHEDDMDRFVRAEQMQAVTLMKRKEADLLWRENEARKRVWEMEEEAKLRIQEHKYAEADDFLSRERKLYRQFRRAKADLEDGLAAQKAVLREKFGELTSSGEQDSTVRSYEATLSSIPQPVEMRVHSMRAVKTKLPKGEYCLMVSVFDQLGGRPLCFANVDRLGSDERPAVTSPHKHEGRFYDRSFAFEQSIFTVCPARADRRPSHVYVFELFHLTTDSGGASKQDVNADDVADDRVVAWSALPICDEHMGCIEGKLKLPFLRGEHSPQVSTFKDMEIAMATDLNNWLANLYIEIRMLSRTETTLEDTKKRMINFDFVRKLAFPLAKGASEKESGDEGGGEDTGDEEMGLPELDGQVFRRRTDSKRSSRAGSASAKIASSASGSSAHTKRRQGRPVSSSHKSGKVGAQNESGSEGEGDMRSGGIVGRLRNALGGTSAKRGPSPNQDPRKVIPQHKNPNDVLDSELDERPVVWERGYHSGDDERMHPEQAGKLAGADSVGDASHRQWAEAGLEGRVVRRNHSDGPRFDSEAIRDPFLCEEEDRATTMLKAASSTGLAAVVAKKEKDWAPPLLPEHYEAYAMSIVVDPSQRRRVLPNMVPRTKMRFLVMELLGDLFPGKWATFDFYVTLFIYLVCMWIAMFVHYVGQYFYTSFLTPVYGFDVQAHQVMFKYMSESLADYTELGVVVAGPLANLFLFSALAGLADAMQRFPRILIMDALSTTVASYGVVSIINPLLIAFYSVCAENFNCESSSLACKEDYTSMDCDCFNADFLKLYYRFVREEGAGLTGILLTLFAYITTGTLTCLALYVYMVYSHRDAKLMDLWRRIAAPPEEFFCPEDLEMSYDDLRSTITMATRWRGPNGQRRRTAVSQYYERDAGDPMFSQANRYVAIYEVHGRHEKTIYRHFTILHNGTILEVFGNFDMELIDENDSDSLLKLTQSDMEKKPFGDLKYYV